MTRPEVVANSLHHPGGSVIDTQPTPLNRALDRIASGALVIACIALVCMATVEAWQVFARYVLNNSPSWTEPVALVLMSTTMMFGAAVGVRANKHFGFFIVAHNASPPVRGALHVIARLIATSIGVMFAVWGGEMLIDAWDFPMAGAPLPQGIVFLPMCLGGALIAIFSLEQMFAPLPATIELVE